MFKYILVLSKITILNSILVEFEADKTEFLTMKIRENRQIPDIDLKEIDLSQIKVNEF